MSNKLTKPLVVPEFSNGIVKLYIANPASGDTPVPVYTIDIKDVLINKIGITAGSDGNPPVVQPNSCAINDNDLFVSISSGNAAAIIKFPGYLTNPSLAKEQAFIFTFDGNDYVGMAFDAAGNLFATEGDFANNNVIKYTGTAVAYPGPAKAKSNNYGTKSVLGNAGINSYLADMVFDAAGNLWATDYLNNRVVVFTGGTNTFHTLNNINGPLTVANSASALKADSAHLFAQPEGIDVDASGNLWIANNNDGNNGVKNSLTSLVKITVALQQAVLTNAARDNSTFSIYQVPNLNNNLGAQPQLGGLQIDKPAGRIFVNEEVAHKGRWYDIGTIANIGTTTVTNDLDITSTNPGNGGIALVSTTNPVPILYMQDTTGDDGSEPDTTTSRPWESIDIWVNDDGSAVPKQVAGGSSCFVCVRVHNTGISANTGSEQLKVYWAKGGSGLGWPAPWDGSKNITIALGNTVGTKNTGTIQPGESTILVFPWTAPNPTDYISMFPAESDHFCLLARIETSSTAPFGMTTAEGPDLFQNVLNNNKIAWENIHITPTAKSIVGIIASNYTAASMAAQLSFEVLDAEAKPADVNGELILHVQGTSLARLMEANANNDHIKYLGEGKFEVSDVKGGITNIILKPGETFPFNIEYTPSSTETKGYALRVIQYAQDGGSLRVIGGQTAVFGKVKGFPAQQTKEKEQSKLWWLIFATSALLFFILFRKEKTTIKKDKKRRHYKV